jgi:tRNA-Thr(GGU) m(6)t(6)A37 methyltransferase TsaA
MQAPKLELTAIGIVHSPWQEKGSAPRQPSEARGVAGRIELFGGGTYEHALHDIETWSHLWVLFWFHRNSSWRAKVEPPRSQKKRGVFATRSPYRPNPIGLSVVKLTRVEGCELFVEDLDILDQTPVFDLKPYVAYTDSVPNASAGWLGSEAAPIDAGPRYEVAWVPRAQAQLAWLAPQLAFDLKQAAEAVLRAGPTPHPYRRIKRLGQGYVLAIKDFRVQFTLGSGVVEIQSIASGYRARVLKDPKGVASDSTPLSVHRAFTKQFGDATESL